MKNRMNGEQQLFAIFWICVAVVLVGVVAAYAFTGNMDCFLAECN